MQTSLRSLSRIADNNYDVVVIGGGIMGCGIGWDAALRGFKTLILEREDFGSKTSAGCFRIVHGGLRYLQHLNFRRVCQSAREQQILRTIAPHLVKPLPFLIPCYGFGMKGKPILRVALSVYETLTYWRNRGVLPSHRLPNHRVLNVEETLRLAPGLNTKGLTGGIVYYDCQLAHCERFTLAIARAAAAAGADVFNYAEVTDVHTEDSSIQALSVFDRLSGDRYTIHGRSYVNSAGPWLYSILDRAVMDRAVMDRAVAPPPLAENMPFSTGIQVVIPQIVKECAVAVESREQDAAAVISRGGRSFFVQPWRGTTLVGTSEKLFLGDPDRFEITEKEIREFIADFCQAYQDSRISPESVSFAFGGVRAIDPGQRSQYSSRDNPPARPPLVRRHDQIMDHAEKMTDHRGYELPRLKNLLSVEGVKYTTFRSVAEQTVNRLCRKLGSGAPSASASTPLPGAIEREDTSNGDRGYGVLIDQLLIDYGSEAHDVAALSWENPDLAQPLGDGCEVVGAQVIYAVRNEYARKLSDVVFRRTIMGLIEFPGDAALVKAAELMASELGWSQSTVDAEIEEVAKVFRCLPNYSSSKKVFEKSRLVSAS